MSFELDILESSSESKAYTIPHAIFPLLPSLREDLSGWKFILVKLHLGGRFERSGVVCLVTVFVLLFLVLFRRAVFSRSL
jgi:hypothetical protein